jgi:hypothetical protein
MVIASAAIKVFMFVLSLNSVTSGGPAPITPASTPSVTVHIPATIPENHAGDELGLNGKM